MPFSIANHKIIWPQEQFDKIKAEFGEGTGWYKNDLLDIAERANLLVTKDDSILFNEILAGELGIDLHDVWDAISDKVERAGSWTTFEEYKELRKNSLLTFEEFVTYFQIAAE